MASGEMPDARCQDPSIEAESIRGHCSSSPTRSALEILHDVDRAQTRLLQSGMGSNHRLRVKRRGPDSGGHASASPSDALQRADRDRSLAADSDRSRSCTLSSLSWGP